MPTNFTGNIDTVMPTIAGYQNVQDSTGDFLSNAGQSMGQLGDYISSARQENARLQALADKQAAEEKKNVTLSGIAQEQLSSREQMVRDLGNIRDQQTKLLATVDPTDAAGVARVMRERDRLEAQARQLGVNNAAQQTALLRRAINTYPQYTEDLIKTFNASETAFSNVFAENNDTYGIGGKDYKTSNAAALDVISTHMAKTGIRDPAIVMNALRQEEKLRNLETELKIGTVTGDMMAGDGISIINGILTGGSHNIALNSASLKSPDAAEVFAREYMALQRKRFDAWKENSIKNGAKYSPAQEQEFRASLSATENALVQIARAAAAHAPTGEKMRGDANYIQFAMLAATTDNPVLNEQFRMNPKASLEFYDNLMKSVRKLGTLDIKAIQVEAKKGGPNAAEYRQLLQAATMFARVTAAQGQALGTPEGKAIFDNMVQVEHKLQNGTFDPEHDLIPGTMAELIGVDYILRAQANGNPAAHQAVVSKAVSDATRLSATVPGVERFLTAKTHIDMMKNSETRTTVVSAIQTQVERVIGNLSGKILYNTAAIQSPDPNSKTPVFTLKQQPAPVMAIPGFGVTSMPTAAGDPALQAQVDYLNSAFRVLAKYKEGGPSQVVSYFREALHLKPDAITSKVATNVSDIQVKQGEPGANPSTWGKREDGSNKGTGWLGVLRRPDGGISTEITMQAEADGKDITFPLLVPTLTRSEVDTLLSLNPESDTFQQDLPAIIFDKALKFAMGRVAKGKSPFASASESPGFKK